MTLYLSIGIINLHLLMPEGHSAHLDLAVISVQLLKIKRPQSPRKPLFLFSPGDSAEKLKGGEEKCGEKKFNIKRATTYCIYYGSRIFRRFPPTLFSSFEP